MMNDTTLGGVYIILAMVLVLSGLMVRREKFSKLAVYALAWVAIFAAGFIIFTFRDNLGWVWQRVRAEATGEPVRQGEQLRIPMAIDGHFWVDARVNGERVKFLVDSGATMTTIDRRTAERAGVRINPAAGQLVQTGNGVIRVASGRADELQVGSIERSDFRMHVAERDGLNVLGMNFLSTLQRWSVEGRWLVLDP